MTPPAAPPRQYGGNTPPAGYVQFLVENWAHVTPGFLPPTPCLIWVRASKTVITDPGCSELEGHAVSGDTLSELRIASHPWPTLCPYYGRIIE